MAINKITSLTSGNGLRAFVVAGLLQLALPRSSRAEDSVSYMHQSYQETNGRIQIDSDYATIDAQLPAEVRMKLTGVIDTISGATPTGEIDKTKANPVVLSEMHDRRKAWHLELSRQFKNVNVAVGYDNSRESDYLSRGYSLNTVTDFNDKNTSLTVGFSGTDDEVKFFGPEPLRKKRSYDAIVGLTQLINADTTVTANLSYGKVDGFMSDPYKLVQQPFEVLEGIFQDYTYFENRPDQKEKWILFLASNHHVAKLDGAAEVSYRFYRDDFGITANTFSVSWYQNFFEHRLKVIPSLRYYTQSAADFYYVTLDGAGFTPPDWPTGKAPYYSSDYRLSRMDTIDYGLKMVWDVVPDRFAVTAAYDRYDMKGKDGITPKQAYASANIFSIGAKLTW